MPSRTTVWDDRWEFRWSRTSSEFFFLAAECTRALGLVGQSFDISTGQRLDY